MEIDLKIAKNLIVTGVPRAGTSLASALLDGLVDAVSINEPKWQHLWSREENERSRYVERIAADFVRVRATLLAGGCVPVRVQPGGDAITNFFDDSPEGRKRLVIENAPMARPGLTSDFLLAMKHNAHYSCVLPELARLEGFAVLAIVRDPRAILASWRSLDLPVSRGRIPAAEPFWPEVRAARVSTDKLLTVQARLVELFFARFLALDKRITIVKLEDVIADPLLFSRLTGRAQVRLIKIEPSKIASLLEESERAKIKEAVIRHCPAASLYYHVT
jgi:hypothetical protein